MEKAHRDLVNLVEAARAVQHDANELASYYYEKYEESKTRSERGRYAYLSRRASRASASAGLVCSHLGDAVAQSEVMGGET
jgi:hypothetical protein